MVLSGSKPCAANEMRKGTEVQPFMLRRPPPHAEPNDLRSAAHVGGVQVRVGGGPVHGGRGVHHEVGGRRQRRPLLRPKPRRQDTAAVWCRGR